MFKFKKKTHIHSEIILAVSPVARSGFLSSDVPSPVSKASVALFLVVFFVVLLAS